MRIHAFEASTNRNEVYSKDSLLSTPIKSVLFCKKVKFTM
jgi:hypothetical protein